MYLKPYFFSSKASYIQILVLIFYYNHGLFFMASGIVTRIKLIKQNFKNNSCTAKVEINIELRHI